eukprot:2834164-Prymnesium_polylepis.2
MHKVEILPWRCLEPVARPHREDARAHVWQDCERQRERNWERAQQPHPCDASPVGPKGVRSLRGECRENHDSDEHKGEPRIGSNQQREAAETGGRLLEKRDEIEAHELQRPHHFEVPRREGYVVDRRDEQHHLEVADGRLEFGQQTNARGEHEAASPPLVELPGPWNEQGHNRQGRQKRQPLSH